MIDKAKCTYCENDPFPISDIKDAENMHLINSVFLTIINMSIAQAVFPQSEKLACIKPTYKGRKCYTWKSISLQGKSFHGDNGVFNNE